MYENESKLGLNKINRDLIELCELELQSRATYWPVSRDCAACTGGAQGCIVSVGQLEGTEMATALEVSGQKGRAA